MVLTELLPTPKTSDAHGARPGTAERSDPSQIWGDSVTDALWRLAADRGELDLPLLATPTGDDELTLDGPDLADQTIAPTPGATPRPSGAVAPTSPTSPPPPPTTARPTDGNLASTPPPATTAATAARHRRPRGHRRRIRPHRRQRGLPAAGRRRDSHAARLGPAMNPPISPRGETSPIETPYP